MSEKLYYCLFKFVDDNTCVSRLDWDEQRRRQRLHLQTASRVAVHY